VITIKHKEKRLTVLSAIYQAFVHDGKTYVVIRKPNSTYMSMNVNGTRIPCLNIKSLTCVAFDRNTLVEPVDLEITVSPMDIPSPEA
jgi:hypothetical protein